MRSIAAVTSLESYLRAVAAGRDDRRLVDKIGEIGAGEPRGHGGNAIEIDFGIELDLVHMHLQDFEPPLAVGTIDKDLAVEAAGPEQRGIENFRPVGRGKQYDAGRGVEAVELGEELIKRLFLLVMAAECRPLGASGRGHRVRR